MLLSLVFFKSPRIRPNAWIPFWLVINKCAKKRYLWFFVSMAWKWTTHEFTGTCQQDVIITCWVCSVDTFQDTMIITDNNINALVHIYNVTRAFVTTHALMRLACFNHVRCEKWSHSCSAARSTRVIIFHISTWLKLASLSALWFTKSLVALYIVMWPSEVRNGNAFR